MLTNTRTSSWVNALVNTRMNLKLAGFAGLVTAATAWTLWGGEMFPAEPDPTGGSTVVSTPGLQDANGTRSRELDSRGDAEMASCGMHSFLHS